MNFLNFLSNGQKIIIVKQKKKVMKGSLFVVGFYKSHFGTNVRKRRLSPTLSVEKKRISRILLLILSLLSVSCVLSYVNF